MNKLTIKMDMEFRKKPLSTTVGSVGESPGGI